MIVYGFQAWASSLILLCLLLNISYIAFIGCPLWLIATVTWRDVDTFFTLILCKSSSKSRLVVKNRCAGSEALEILGDWEMVLYCQSSSMSLLITTLAVCFYLEAHQHHNKFVSSCLVPDQFLSSYFPDIDLISAEKKFRVLLQYVVTGCF